MALSRLSVKQHRSNSNLARGHFGTQSKSKIGYARAVFTACSILIGAVMYYIALHYVPALSNPRDVLKFATESKSLPPKQAEFDFEESRPMGNRLNVFYKLFTLDRAYMRAGETIEIRYDLPEQTTVNLDILQCRRVWAIEIFKCTPLNQFGTKKGPGRGMAEFKLDTGGFYHFRHEVSNLKAGDSYHLLWQRG